MSAAETFAPLIRDVAVKLLGEPNKELSNGSTLRWGSRGSFKVDIPEGLWHDHEAKEGGGTIDLIMRERRCDKSGAREWLEGEGLIEPRDTARTFYDYTDETGAVLFKVERLGKGNIPPFVQHGPDGQGGFVCRKGCMAGVRKVLYRLDLLAAAPRDALVFVTEGEKDCDRLIALGLVATTNPGGAGKFNGLQDCIAKHLAGRCVIILQDNDEAGANHVAAGSAAIRPHAAAVAGLKLDGLTAKGDVSDWLNNGGKADKLVELATAALADAKSDPPTVITASPYRWRDPATLPSRPWLYGRALLRGGPFVVIAPGATGKTSLKIGTALALVTGRPLLGIEVWDGPKRVWIWNLEDSLADLAFAIQGAALHWGLTEEDLADRLYVDSGIDGATLKLARPGRDGPQINAQVSEQIVAELKRRKIDVLMIDPFISSHGLNDENDNAAIDLVAKEWSRIASAAQCAVVLAHHARKSNGTEITAESARGASALVDAARGGWALNTMTKAEAESFGIPQDQRRRFFRADDAKPNRAPPGAGQWYEMVSSYLGNGDGGGDSVGVATPWNAPDPFDDVTTHHLRAVQAKIADGVWRENIQAGDWAGKVVAEVLCLDLDIKAEKKRAKLVLAKWIENGALRIDERPDRNGDPRKFVIVGGVA
ncbi:MAG: AAA family ATPase [Novosphingobium sp.]|nr:AAA family ATPase [Novosphingobium sp.]